MEEKIEIHMLDTKIGNVSLYRATAREIGRIFEIAEHIPDEWTKMDVEKLAERIAGNIKNGDTDGDKENIQAEGNN